MTKQLKKRPIEKELKFLADFELYGVLMFAGMYFATKFIIDMDFGKNVFKLNWISFYPLLIFSAIAAIPQNLVMPRPIPIAILRNQSVEADGCR